MTKEEEKEYGRAWEAAHREERRIYRKAYHEAHKDESKAWREAHKEKCKAYKKAYYASHKEHCIASSKADVNSYGVPKSTIRKKSRYILKKMHLHIPRYEIYHCFGYDDPAKFIYISRSLHMKIHQYLRDNKIDTGTDHWPAIKDIINSTYEYIYINR